VYALLIVVLSLIVLAVFISCGNAAPPTHTKGERTVETKADITVPPLADSPEKLAPGVQLTIEELATNKIDRRSVRLIALYVPSGTPPTPFLAPGPFKATWESTLTVALRDDYVFSAEGRGTLVFELDGKKVLEVSGDDLSKTASTSFKLKKGPNKIVARYESPKEGDAWIRMFWTPSEFPREPLPIVQLTHNIENKPLRESRRLHEGRELYAELRCARCHDAAPYVVPKADEVKGMPEMSMDAPNLSNAGERLQEKWMVNWIKNPRGLRPDTAMPRVLHGAATDKEAADIAAYLATLGKKVETPAEAPTDEDIKNGGVVFAMLGCFACHTLPDREEAAADRIPLRYVRSKWNPDALQKFLKQPDTHYLWIRMPNFRLSDTEATKLSTFIRHQKIENKKWLIEEPKTAGDKANGEKLVQSKGCVNCHTVNEKPSELKAPAMKAITSWSKGCMGPDEAARGNAPDFSLTQPQRDALLAFAAAGTDSLKQEALPEFAERQIKDLRCIACHKRDLEEDQWSSLESEVEIWKTEGEKVAGAAGGDEPKLIEQRKPWLTWTGEKLKPEWMTAFLAGQVKYKPRPWLFSRMPGFPRRAEMLSKGLAMQHGCPPVSPPPEKQDPQLAEVGKRLAGEKAGFACIKCHAVGKADGLASGVFEAPGTDFMHINSRMVKSYYHRFIGDPIRVEEGHKMPTFAPGGHSQLTEVFEGDGRKQFEALWHYLMAGEKIKPPDE